MGGQARLDMSRGPDYNASRKRMPSRHLRQIRARDV
jgi:hypothetical protein